MYNSRNLPEFGAVLTGNHHSRWLYCGVTSGGYYVFHRINTYDSIVRLDCEKKIADKFTEWVN